MFLKELNLLIVIVSFWIFFTPQNIKILSNILNPYYVGIKNKKTVD